MKVGYTPIVRTEISDTIEKNLGKRIIFIYGNKGSGKSFIAKAIAKNDKLNKKIDEEFFYKCVTKAEKENDNQIFSYDSFLSNILINFKYYKYITADANFERKQDDLKESLKNDTRRIFFVFDDFDRLPSEDGENIVNFLKNTFNSSNYNVIITSTEKLEYCTNDSKRIYEKKIETLKYPDFERICERYIDTIQNTTFKKNIITIRKEVGEKDFYNCIWNKIDKDLCLMKDMLQDIEYEICNEKDFTNIKSKFYSLLANYHIERGALLKKILKSLKTTDKKILYTISFFEKPVSIRILKEISNIKDSEIRDFEINCMGQNRFDGFLHKHKDNTYNKYFVERPLKKILREEINDKDFPYSTCINNWIKHYINETNDIAKKLDYDLSGLDNIEDEFDNISRVLDYCYNKKERWQDYYSISDNIWYFCELKNKDIDEYHHKRYLIAKKLNDNYKIFDSALHYCNISCKINISDEIKNPLSSNAHQCFDELEKLKTSNSVHSKRFINKFEYTLGLQHYGNNEFNSANCKFILCEKELPEIIRQEKNIKEKNQLIKDFISTVKWHSNCFYKDICKDRSLINTKEKEFEKLSLNIDKAIAYELNNRINYSRVIVNIIMHRIKILLLFNLNEKNKAIVRNDYAVLEDLENSVIKDDLILKQLYKEVCDELDKYDLRKQIKLEDYKRINNYSLDDSTQEKIIPILKETKELFLKAIKKESRANGKVSLTAMPDLGLANNITRMSGGFFTGMFLEWESEIPIVPIDTTINSCGVAIYLLKNKMSVKNFEKCFVNVDKKIKEELGYNWNFQRGNHFITLGKLENGRYCIVMHASADEYKKDMGDKSLYPPGNDEEYERIWYSKDIKTVRSTSNKNRYLRYLYGDAAKKFISIAIRLEIINHIRMKEISEYLFRDYIDKELIFIPHYGMPNKNSIAIGCSWKKEKSVLLTAPGKDIYIIKPSLFNDDEKWLTPHGLGVSATIDSIKYQNGLYVNNKLLKTPEDVKEIKGRSIRCRNDDDEAFKAHMGITLTMCKGEIDNDNIIHPIATLSTEGFNKYVRN